MKKYSAVLVAFVLIFSLCSTVFAEEPAQISFLCSAGGSGRSFEGGLNRFIEANGDKINVSIDMIALASMPDQLMTQFISGQAFYDAIAINSVWQASMSNYLLPLDDYIAKDQLDLSALYGDMSAYTYNGHIIGLPIRTGTDVLQYRKDFLEAKNVAVPTDLQSLLEAARALTSGPEDNRDVYGFAYMAQDPFFCTNMTADFLFSHGIYFLSEEMTAANEDLKTDAASAIFDVIYKLYDEKLMPNPMSWTYDDSIVAFQEGKIAMTMDDFMRAPTIEKEGTSANGNMGYVAFTPEVTGSQHARARGGWWILSIDKNAKNPDACWEFIKYMCSLETQTYMANERSNGPSILTLLDDPTFNEVNHGASAAKVNYGALGVRDPVSIDCREELANAIQDCVHRLFLGELSPSEVGSAMYDAISEILADYE